MAKKGLSQTQAYLIIAAVSLIFIVAIAGFFTLPTTKATGKDPGSSTSTPVSSASGYTASLWQSLYIKNQDGSSYWANAPAPFTLASIFGSPSGNGDDFNRIATEQSSIYMNLGQAADSWTFSCQETIALETTTGTVIGYFTQSGLTTTPSSFTVNANGQTAVANQNLAVTSAIITETQLQTFLNQPAGTYYFVVSLGNIDLQLTVNGQTATLTSAAGTSQNTLSWLIQIS